MKWNLLYRGSRDGLNSKAFHSKCDSSNKLLVILKTKLGEIIGGYTSLNWSLNQNIHNYNNYYFHQGYGNDRMVKDPNEFFFKFDSSTNDFITKLNSQIRFDSNIDHYMNYALYIGYSQNYYMDYDSQLPATTKNVVHFDIYEIEVFNLN